MWMTAAYRQTQSWSEGQQQVAEHRTEYIHQMKRVNFSKWLSHDDSTKNIVRVLLLLVLINFYLY